MTPGAALALLTGLACAVAGASVRRRRPGHPVGGLLLAVGLVLVLAGALLVAGALVAGGTGAGGTASDVAAVAVTAAVGLGLPWVVLCYPAGWPAGPVDRSAAAGVTVLGCALLAGVLVASELLVTVAAWGLVVAVIAVVWWRTERSVDQERRALLWLALGLTGPGLVVGVAEFLADAGDLPGGAPALVAVTVVGAATALACAVVGLVSPRAVDVRRVISQTTRYAVSAQLVLAVYVGAPAVADVVGLGPTGDGPRALLAVGLAAAFHPVSLVVQRLFDELIFGRRADPVAVMSSLGAELRAGGAPERWVEALRDALGVPRLELWSQGSELAAAGVAAGGGGTARLPLQVGDAEAGALVVHLPPGEAALPAETAAVLHLVAIPLAQALQGVRLSGELAHQRTSALGALEEERRRLRRDLHDGLGPVLTGIAYSADAARNLVRTDPQQAGELLAALREDTASSIAEVRRLVHGLRPPALDERGLAGAVLQRVERLRCADGGPLVTEVVATGSLAGLPAAVEVAAYRVAVEAVTNIARHARAPAPAGGTRTACVRFAVGGDELVLTVTDGGAGRSPWVPGVGLTSMRERCEQLHGRLTAGPTPDGGEVRAVLPLS